jgi:hypothetical protein
MASLPSRDGTEQGHTVHRDCRHQRRPPRFASQRWAARDPASSTHAPPRFLRPFTAGGPWIPPSLPPPLHRNRKAAGNETEERDGLRKCLPPMRHRIFATFHRRAVRELQRQRERGLGRRRGREGAGEGGAAMGRADEWGGRGGRDWGEAVGFVRRSRFSPYTKREATRKSGMAAPLAPGPISHRPSQKSCR